MDDDARDPKILEMQAGAVEREGTLSLEHMLAYQPSNTDVHGWEHCSIVGVEPAPASHPDEEQRNARIVCLLALSRHVSTGILEGLLVLYAESWWQDSFMKKSQSISSKLHLLQLFAQL